MIKATSLLPLHPETNGDIPISPLGSKTKILFTSVFGPYAQDDEYGSRKMNPMELYHNQVTRTQGPFSLRMFHRSWGLMLIQANISAPAVVLDFPVLDRFIEELKTNQYDVIGISSIIPNEKKVQKMCQLIRQYQPDATIVVGGHISNVPNLADRVDVDFVARGDGVRWFREFIGDDPTEPINHPAIKSGYGARNIGMTLSENPGDVAATVIPSVGCPLGCNFCSTSAMFGGKGKFIDFYSTGDELFEIMDQLEKEMKVQSFFMMDENFLYHKKRALRLLELMEKHNKSWALYVFSSANVLKTYTREQLLGLGISWVWMGLEGEDSRYKKLQGTDAYKLIKDLQADGVRILGSSIIGLENHTPENIDDAIEYAAHYDTDFHQFMLYTPIPGTPLHKELSDEGRIIEDADSADIHGQLKFNYRHTSLPGEAMGEIMIRAFDRDFELNGPSTVRIARTTLAGYLRHKNHPDPRIRRRFHWEARSLSSEMTALVAGSKRYFKGKDQALYEKMSALLKELIAEFGWKARFYATVGGRYVSWKIRQEEKRLDTDWTYEPPMFYEKNKACGEKFSDAQLCKWVESPKRPVANKRVAAPHLVRPKSADTVVASS
jgi:radical SAM superfamily enzyme YgiQ (UPF0313 family)